MISPESNKRRLKRDAFIATTVAIGSLVSGGSMGAALALITNPKQERFASTGFAGHGHRAVVGRVPEANEAAPTLTSRQLGSIAVSCESIVDRRTRSLTTVPATRTGIDTAREAGYTVCYYDNRLFREVTFTSRQIGQRPPVADLEPDPGLEPCDQVLRSGIDGNLNSVLTFHGKLPDEGFFPCKIGGMKMYAMA